MIINFKTIFLNSFEQVLNRFQKALKKYHE